MTANNVVEIETDNVDLPLKQEECSQHTNDHLGGHGSSIHNCANASESNGLDQRGTSFLGLESPGNIAQSIDPIGNGFKELKVENYKNTVSGVVDLPSSTTNLLVKQGQWSHLYKLVDRSKNKGGLEDPFSRSKDKLKASIQERRGDPNSWLLRHLKTRHVDETGVCVDLKKGENPNSESQFLPQDARLKILSTSSFSQFFGSKTLKGKGVIHAHPGDKNEIASGATFQTTERLFSTVSTAIGAPMQLLQYHNGGIQLDSNHDGISLRDWLIRRHHGKSKAERLFYFREIVELVNLAHSQGFVLQHLRPSYFTLMTSKKLKYIGLSTQADSDVSTSQVRCKKRPTDDDIHVFCTPDKKQQKLISDLKFENHVSLDISKSDSSIATHQEANYGIDCPSGSDYSGHKVLRSTSHQATEVEKSLLADLLLEEKWYACPEERSGRGCKFSSNIYSLGVLLFELLCPFDSMEARSNALLDMHHRILPPFFLSESPKEAGFCLWLIHPEPLSRPTIREILLSDLFCGTQDWHSSDEIATSANNGDMAESELLLDFLVSLKEQKQDHAVGLIEDIRCIEADLKGFKSLPTSNSGLVEKDYSLHDFMKLVARSGGNEVRLLNNMSQLEKAYFSKRSSTTVTSGSDRADRDLLKNREAWFQLHKQNEAVSKNQKSIDGLDIFFEGLCKFTCYSKFELCGTLRNNDLLNSANVICSLSFDRDEEYIAIAGVSKKIKIFEYSSLANDIIDIHYPVIEMGNKSKLSCISWNTYIRNLLASTDYDGIVQVWDASTGLGFSQHIEHQKRAWSVDFSQVDPTKFASGSDDCSVKLWCTNEKRSTSTIWSPANVCCVQFSPYSSHLLAFGSADYNIYCYDLRHTRIPWCTLAGHEKAVSYVKFLDAEMLVSASTDNTLKLWDLNKTSLSGPSSHACHLTYSGHTNKKHFVGLSVLDGYIACGSESNEVFTYYRSLPMPITSYKFNPLTPLREFEEDNGLFVSSVCWRSKSNMVVAANTGGSIRLLQLV